MQMKIDTSQPFGAMVARAVAQLIQVMDQIDRINAAVANAQSGFAGTAGTEFENTMFGVVPSGTPGEQGAAYAYAVGTLKSAKDAFWTSAAGAVSQLDNGAVPST